MRRGRNKLVRRYVQLEGGPYDGKLVLLNIDNDNRTATFYANGRRGFYVFAEQQKKVPLHNCLKTVDVFKWQPR